jgi:DNA-binding HxlR family transcriptional regulator
MVNIPSIVLQVGINSVPNMHNETKDADCPMTRVIGAISSKWAMPVLYNLLRAAGPMRFGELRHAIGKVTQRELSLTLKRFEELGLVSRKVYAEVPPRVEYRLTALGRSLEAPILALGRWAEQHARELTPRDGKRVKAAR